MSKSRTMLIILSLAFWFYDKTVVTVMINNSTNINKENNHLSSQTIKHIERMKSMKIPKG